MADVHLNWLNWFHYLILDGGLLFILIAGFDLAVSRSQNAIYFSITAIPNKSLCNTKLCAKHEKNTREFHLYCWDHVCKVNESCLVDCFHSEFRVSTQIMVRGYYIAKCKKSACDGLLMALWAIFFRDSKYLR